MHLLIQRTYHPNGVNGELYINGVLQCYTIELPWKYNQPQRSCIPEGTYVLTKRWSPKFKWHLLVNDVKNRSMVLIHPANDAVKELKGCIAPVTTITGEGKGRDSRMAFQKITEPMFAVMNTETVFLTIREKKRISQLANKSISQCDNEKPDAALVSAS